MGDRTILVSYAALLAFGTLFSCSTEASGPAVQCEGLSAVGAASAHDRVIVGFRNVSGHPIAAFRARYEARCNGQTIAVVDFVCDRRTVRKLDSGDEVPFVFLENELVFVHRVHFRRERLPDRFFVTDANQIAAEIRAGTLLPATGEEDRCTVLEVELGVQERNSD